MKLIDLITKSRTFAFFPIAFFIFAIIKVVLTKGDPFWLNTSYITFSVLGSFVTLTHVIGLVDAMHSPNWPQAKANLTKCEVGEYRSQDSKSYHADIEYEFTVQGQQYKGSRLSFGDFSGSKKRAEKIVQDLNFRKDSLMIYYKPTDPNESLIQPGLHVLNFVGLGVGMAMVISGILLYQGVIELPIK